MRGTQFRASKTLERFKIDHLPKLAWLTWGAVAHRFWFWPKRMRAPADDDLQDSTAGRTSALPSMAPATLISTSVTRHGPPPTAHLSNLGSAVSRRRLPWARCLRLCDRKVLPTPKGTASDGAENSAERTPPAESFGTRFGTTPEGRDRLTRDARITSNPGAILTRFNEDVALIGEAGCTRNAAGSSQRVPHEFT